MISTAITHLTKICEHTFKHWAFWQEFYMPYLYLGKLWSTKLFFFKKKKIILLTDCHWTLWHCTLTMSWTHTCLNIDAQMIKTLRNVVIIKEATQRHLTFSLHSSLQTHFIQLSTLIKNTLYKMDIKKMWHSLKGQAGVYLESSLDIWQG